MNTSQLFKLDFNRSSVAEQRTTEMLRLLSELKEDNKSTIRREMSCEEISEIVADSVVGAIKNQLYRSTTKNDLQ